MRIRKMHWIGGIFGLLIVIVDISFFLGDKLFIFLLGIGFTAVLLPILVGLVLESKKEQEINQQFLEFSRNLAESVKSGTPIGKSILNMKDKGFGPLSPAVKKLANQISVGIPISRAFVNFANEADSEVVKRAISLIREAENAGGEIDHILDSVANSIYEIEKLRKERKNAVSTLVVQGYIIFLIFIGIMLIMEFKILPLTSGINSIGSFSNVDTLASGNFADVNTSTYSPEALARPFLYLLLTQGFFAGLVIGKLSEGTVKSGFKHSIVMIILAFLISSGTRVFLG